MNVGEKIKKIRTAKFMSQRELAGTQITRNMLSRIENGAAQPSMSTITYIAERLNVSPGFLLAGEEDEWLYFKSSQISNIKKAYTDKNFSLCMEMCKNAEWQDDELWLILAECCMRVGVEEFCKGYLRSSIQLFDESLEYCHKTIYNTDVIASSAGVYFSYMKLISPTLSSNFDDSDDVNMILNDEFSIYVRRLCDMSEESTNIATETTLSKDSSYGIHIEAKELMQKDDYNNAFELLRKLLFEDIGEIPLPIIYFVFCDLEVCCKEIGDFKGAYEYSQSKVDLLQKLLS